MKVSIASPFGLIAVKLLIKTDRQASPRAIDKDATQASPKQQFYISIHLPQKRDKV